MRFGRLTKRVSVQEKTEGRGAYGGSSGSTWSTIAERWAGLEPLRASELAAFNSTENRTTHRAWMRYLEGLTTTRHRLLYEGRVYNIVEKRDLKERHHSLELLLIEVEGETS